MDGGQNKREWQSFLQFASRGYKNIYMQSRGKSIFRFMIENIAHTPHMTEMNVKLMSVSPSAPRLSLVAFRLFITISCSCSCIVVFTVVLKIKHTQFIEVTQ